MSFQRSIVTTIGELREALSKLPADAPVGISVVDDCLGTILHASGIVIVDQASLGQRDDGDWELNDSLLNREVIVLRC